MARQRSKVKKVIEAQSPASAGQPEIHISIDAKGNIVLETVGTTGNQCDLLVGTLENSLGRVKSRVNKETYHNG